jgi:hypothetical protein
MLGMIFLTGTSFGSERKLSGCSPTGVWIKLNINLHRPKLNCEKGFGICFLISWGFDDASVAAGKGLCPARGLVNDRNQLVIEIEESTLAKYDGGFAMSNFRDKSSISIQDPYVIPESTCRSLGRKAELTIKPGNYPVSYQNKTYTITFQL